MIFTFIRTRKKGPKHNLFKCPQKEIQQNPYQIPSFERNEKIQTGRLKGYANKRTFKREEKSV